MRQLLAGTEVDAVDMAGRTALHLVAEELQLGRRINRWPGPGRYRRLVKELLRAGATVDLGFYAKGTPSDGTTRELLRRAGIVLPRRKRTKS